MNNIISLRHARSIECGWENEHGQRHWFENPIPYPTFIGTRAHPKRPLSKCDHWRFFIVVRFAAHQVETFYGQRARGIWAEWKRMQFSKPKSNKQNKHGKSRTKQRRSDKGSNQYDFLGYLAEDR